MCTIIFFGIGMLDMTYEDATSISWPTLWPAAALQCTQRLLAKVRAGCVDFIFADRCLWWNKTTVGMGCNSATATVVPVSLTTHTDAVTVSFKYQTLRISSIIWHIIIHCCLFSWHFIYTHIHAHPPWCCPGTGRRSRHSLDHLWPGRQSCWAPGCCELA